MSNYSDMIYSISLLSTKLSLMLLILRVFRTVQRDLFYWLTLALITVNPTFYALFLIIPIVQCTPRARIWSQEEIPGHCLKIFGLYYASASFNLVSDIAMLSVPIYLVWNLKVILRRKIGISGVFSTGGLQVQSSPPSVGLPNPHPNTAATPLFLPY